MRYSTWFFEQVLVNSLLALTLTLNSTHSKSMERLDILKAAFGEQAQQFEDNLVAESKAQFDACKQPLIFTLHYEQQWQSSASYLR